VLRLDVAGRTLQLHAAPVALRPRAEQGIVVVANDVTQLLELDRMKSEFVALVSHELRAPLTSIKGSLEMLRDGLAGEVSARALEMVRVAHRNSERLGRLINDILDLEKLESEGMEFRMHRQELLPLLRTAVESSQGMAETLGVGLQIGTAEGCRVDVDGDRLLQVLTNLISNALRYSPQGETVVVSSVRRHDGGVRVSVIDHGPGVPEELQPRIFRKFAQARGSGERKRGGTGLGLAITKAFVEKMGGQVGFASTPGQGSTFYVDLPDGDTRRSSGELPRIRTTTTPLG
jgi:signal transduction histidine kinase